MSDFLSKDPEKRTKAQELRRRGDLGQISRDELIKGLAELAGVPVGKVMEYQATIKANKELLEYIRKDLKPNYKISILSNAAADYADEILTPEDLRLFDDILVSYKFGLAKPDPKIYKLAAERLGLSAQECVLIDDKRECFESAQSSGMSAVWYRNFEQMKKDLEALLSTSSNN